MITNGDKFSTTNGLERSLFPKLFDSWERTQAIVGRFGGWQKWDQWLNNRNAASWYTTLKRKRGCVREGSEKLNAVIHIINALGSNLNQRWNNNPYVSSNYMGLNTQNRSFSNLLMPQMSKYDPNPLLKMQRQLYFPCIKTQSLKYCLGRKTPPQKTWAEP